MHQRTVAVGALCLVIATAFAQQADAAKSDAKPSATLEVHSEKTRMIMGGTSGKGVLHFRGTDYPHIKSATRGGRQY